MFGLELRRRDNLNNLYEDADRVLEKVGVHGSKISEDIQRLALATSIQKMIQGNYFDICTVRKCCELSGIQIPIERFRVYDTQHCVNWSEMLPEFKQTIVAMLLDDFRHILNPQSVEVVKAGPCS